MCGRPRCPTKGRPHEFVPVSARPIGCSPPLAHPRDLFVAVFAIPPSATRSVVARRRFQMPNSGHRDVHHPHRGLTSRTPRRYSRVRVVDDAREPPLPCRAHPVSTENRSRFVPHRSRVALRNAAKRRVVSSVRTRRSGGYSLLAPSQVRIPARAHKGEGPGPSWGDVQHRRRFRCPPRQAAENPLMSQG